MSVVVEQTTGGPLKQHKGFMPNKTRFCKKLRNVFSFSLQDKIKPRNVFFGVLVGRVQFMRVFFLNVRLYNNGHVYKEVIEIWQAIGCICLSIVSYFSTDRVSLFAVKYVMVIWILNMTRVKFGDKIIVFHLFFNHFLHINWFFLSLEIFCETQAYISVVIHLFCVTCNRCPTP